MLERDFRAKLIDDLRGVGCFVVTIHGHQFQVRGLPDLQVYHPCWTGHLELKVEGNNATKGQQHMMKELRKRGTPAFILDSRGDHIIVLNAEESDVMQITNWRLDRDKKRRAKLLLVALRWASTAMVDFQRNFDAYKYLGEDPQLPTHIQFLRDPEGA